MCHFAWFITSEETTHSHRGLCQDSAETPPPKNELKWAYCFNMWYLCQFRNPNLWTRALVTPSAFCTPPWIPVALFISPFAAIHSAVWWTHETLWVLFSMRRNGHNILQWRGNVFSLNSFINLSLRPMAAGAFSRRPSARRRACDCAVALFRAAGGTQIHYTHLRKGHREKWGNGGKLPLCAITGLCHHDTFPSLPHWRAAVNYGLWFGPRTVLHSSSRLFSTQFLVEPPWGIRNNRKRLFIIAHSACLTALFMYGPSPFLQLLQLNATSHCVSPPLVFLFTSCFIFC